MKQRITAMLLSLVLVLSVSAVSFAAGETSEARNAAAESMEAGLQTGDAAKDETSAEGEPSAEGEVPGEGETPVEGETPAEGEAPAEGETPVEGENAPEEEGPVFDFVVEEPKDNGPLIIFEEIEFLVKKNNLSYKSMLAAMSDVGDLEDALDEMEDTLSDLEDLKDVLEKNPELEGTEAVGGQTMAGVQAAEKEVVAAIASMGSAGDPDVLERQMKNGCNQIIYGAQSLYIALLGMDQQEQALERQLAALDRTVEEMELRYQMGQISQLQLMQVKSGRTSLVSGLTTLRMNISNYKMQLQQMLGKEMTGVFRTEPLPAVTDEQLAALDVETDLKSVRKYSYELYAAAAAEDKDGGASSSTRYAYQETRQQVEMKFRMLYAKLVDCRQVVAASEEALALQEQLFRAEQMKFEQGTISRNALMAAEDELKTARESLQTARTNLASTYHDYQTAVTRGILN